MLLYITLIVIISCLGWFIWARNQAKKEDISDIQRERLRLQEKIALVLGGVSLLGLLYAVFVKKPFRYKMETSSGRIIATSHEDIAQDISRRECDTKKRFLPDLIKKRDACFSESGRVSEVDYPLSYDKTYMRDYSVTLHDLPCDSLDSQIFPNIAAELRTCQTSEMIDPCSMKVKKATEPLLNSLNTLRDENETLFRELTAAQTTLARLTPTPKSTRYTPTVFDEYEFDE